MSATNFIDTVLERNGDYAVYGKGLGDKMRGDAVYGKDPWQYGDRASAAMVGADPGLTDRTSQIAELDRKIAELKSRISSKYGDIGDPVSRYRFVYENDASGYQNAVQGDRSHRQAKELADINHRHAMELQGAAQKKTDVQQKLDAWKQNAIEMDNARYSVAHWQQQLTAAKNAHDTKAYDNAKIELDRANAAYRRAMRNNEALQKQVGSIFGLPQEGEGEGDSQGLHVSVPAGDTDRERMEAFNAMTNELDLIDASVDNMPVDKKAKAQFIADKTAQIDDAEKRIRNSDMLQGDKKALLELVAEKRKALKEYAKPQGKGGQGTKMEKGNWVKATMSLTREQLGAKTDAYLKDTVKDYKATGTPLTKNLVGVLDVKGIPHD